MQLNQISIEIIFLLAFAWCLFYFAWASNFNTKFIMALIGLLVIQGFLSAQGFYQLEGTTPPRVFFLLAPSLMVIVLLFLLPSGRTFLQNLDLKKLTMIHFCRIPIEIVLWQLFLTGLVPKMMTFEGHNLDILSGISAIVVYYLVFIRKVWSSRVLLFWNYLGLGLVLNIAITGLLAAKTPFQMWAFEQSNVAVTLFPYAWLPSMIVPLVILSHIVSIQQLSKAHVR